MNTIQKVYIEVSDYYEDIISQLYLTDKQAEQLKEDFCGYGDAVLFVEMSQDGEILSIGVGDD